MIQKTIETHCKPINIKKATNGTIIIQTTNQKQSERIIIWKQSGKLNLKIYPQLTLNFLKEVIKSPDLTSCFLEEIKLHLKQQGLTDERRISIRKETRIIDTNTYIQTFNKPTALTGPLALWLEYSLLFWETGVQSQIKSSYLLTPPLGQDMTQGQFLSGV